MRTTRPHSDRKGITNTGRVTVRVNPAEIQRLVEWSKKHAEAVGIPESELGVSAAIRMAIRAFLDGATRSVYADEGYTQGLRIAYGEAHTAVKTSLANALSGLGGLPPELANDHKK